MAAIIAVPMMVICCGRGIALFAGAAGAIGGWFSGFGAISALLRGLAVVLFAVFGLSAVVGYLDVVLFPALGIFVALTAYELWRKRGLEVADWHTKNLKGT